MARKRNIPTFAALAGHLSARLRPPFAIVLGSPAEVGDLAAALPPGPLRCFQMDLFQAARLEQELKVLRPGATVDVAADLWDLPKPAQTVIYPVPRGGERALKLD